MEEEIDLREYVRALVRQWRLIAGLALVAAAAALAMSLLQSPSYQATALVVVTSPAYSLQFDPRIKTVDGSSPNYAVYPQLATSDGVLEDLLGKLSPPPQGTSTAAGLRAMLKAKAGTDPSVVQLVATSSDPREAVRIVNAWAEVFALRANVLYGTGDDQVAFFQDQAAQAHDRLARAEQALVAFQAQSQRTALEVQLAAAQQELRDGLAEKARTTEAVRKAQALQAKIAHQPADSHPELADQLVALLLESQALGLGSTIGTLAPVGGTTQGASVAAPAIGLQISDAAIAASQPTTAALSASLQSLVSSLQQQAGQVDARIADAESEVTTLQQQLALAQVEERRLTSERDASLQTYASLASKIDETRIAAQSQAGMAQVASQATAPARRLEQDPLTTVALAGMAGLMIGVLAALVLEWWRSAASQKKAGDVSGDAPGAADGAGAGL